MQLSSIFTTPVVTNPFSSESVASLKQSENKKTKSEKVNKTQFSNVISDAIQKVNNTHIIADNQVESLIRGDEGVSMHGVMLAMQEAQLSTQLLVEVRNKLYDCYKELNNVTL